MRSERQHRQQTIQQRMEWIHRILIQKLQALLPLVHQKSVALQPIEESDHILVVCLILQPASLERMLNHKRRKKATPPPKLKSI
jgi:hypothetical protein